MIVCKIKNLAKTTNQSKAYNWVSATNRKQLDETPKGYFEYQLNINPEQVLSSITIFIDASSGVLM